MNTATAKSAPRPMFPGRLEANRRNAQRSTGPRSPQAKAIVRLNARRHDLTGQVSILPDEDRKAVEAFCAPLMLNLNPGSALERQLARAIAEDMWRLNRARSIEDNWFAAAITYGPEEPAGDGHPEILAALKKARAFADDSQNFQRLTLYEQRIHRSIARNRVVLAEVRSERLRVEASAMEEARLLRRICKQKGLPFDPASEAKANGGIVLSIAQIDASAARHSLLAEARAAENSAPVPPGMSLAAALRPFLVNAAARGRVA